MGSGCGLISGLDDLSVLDASSADAALEGEAFDVSDAGTTTSDASTDASDGTCPMEMAVDKCFGASCFSTTCCLDTDGATCNMTCSGVPFACIDSAQCNAVDAAPVCCLEHIAWPTEAGCPLVLAVPPPTTGNNKAQALCVPTGGCSATLMQNARLCADDNDCIGSDTCALAAIETDPAVTFGVCVP